MSPHKSYIRLGFWALVIFILVILSSFIFSGPMSSWSKTFKFVFRSYGLSQIIQKDLQGTDGEYAVYIEDLSDGENYSFRADELFPAASLYKVYLMAAVLDEVEGGRLKMEDGITSTKSHLINVYGSVDTGYEDVPENIEYTIEEALTRVGRVSDNFASIMLTDKIGVDKIQQMADSLGVTQTIIKNPVTTSAKDVGLFFKKLYLKEVISASASAKLTEFLSLNQLNSRIPAGLPEGVKVIHKTGELSRIRHDAGIVYMGNRAYIIVLMSQNLKYEDDGVETLKNISKDVYEYFSNKK